MNINKKVVMFAGKGGVGKTTVSCAAAIHFASQGEKTLIISTDPAPSLSDIFEMKIGDSEKKIKENLYALELSSDEVLRMWRQKFGDEIYEVISSFVDAEYEIVDYVGTAPGIDEEFMLYYIHELARQEKYDRIIWDSAPMGHTLRLLKLPSQFIEHLNQAVKVYMKFNIKWGKRSIFDIIQSWKKLAEEIVEFLKNETTFVAVTIPEALSILQTERLVLELCENDLSIKKIVINNVIKDECCEFHKQRILMQKEYIKQIKEIKGKIQNIEIIEILSFPYEIKGLKRLKEVEKNLF
ncbi:MAG: hypothetical protein A7315_12460 [Candidatus Altiarchaeales archaeon WOR_SM1_79]|nr:MAG: hypothetical protein A7315_12460 [Candidatus Altiarchaeales archaeon WOR_SM1_79]